MSAMDVNNYNVQKCWRHFLTIRNPETLPTNVSDYYFFGNAGDNVSNYNFQKCWRQTLTIRMSRNAGDVNYIYNFWRAPHQLYL